MSDEPQPSRIQREAIRILAETITRGSIKGAVIEAELAGLDEFTQRAVREQLQKLFDAMVGLGPDEVREPIPGLTISRPTGKPQS